MRKSSKKKEKPERLDGYCDPSSGVIYSTIPFIGSEPISDEAKEDDEKEDDSN